MYLDFFEFNRKPFGSTPDPDFFYQTAATRKVYDQIIHVIRQQQRCVQLTGEPGTGKTALLKSLMADAELMIHWIFIDLAMEILPHDDYSGYLFDRLKEKISGFDSLADYQTIIIDGAYHLDNNLLQKLFKLQTLNHKKGVVFTIVCVGKPGVDSTYVDTDHSNFATHPNDNFKLKAFDYQETLAAIAYRLKIAGYQGPELFTSDAQELIYQLSGGIPRTVFQICESALFLTDYHKQQEVTPQLVRKASRYHLVDKGSQQGKELIAPSRAAPDRTKSGWQVSMERGVVAGLLILLGAGAWFLLRPAPTHKPQDPNPTLTTQPPSKDSLQHTKKTAVSPESSFQVTATEIAPVANAKPNSPDDEPELGASLQTVEERPGQTPPELLFLENLPPPAAGINKNSTPALVADTKKPIYQPDDKAIAVSVVQTNNTNYNDLNSPDLFHPPIQQIPTDIIAEIAPAIEQIQTKQPAPIPNGTEQQASPEVSTQARKKIAAVPPQPQKPGSPSKLHFTMITPDTARTPSSTQRTTTAPRTVTHPKGGDLVIAVENEQLEEVQLLLENGADVNSINDTGETALMRAAWIGQTKILTLLLNQDPRVNQQSPEGWTALFYGAVKGHKVIVARLLAQGAKPDITDLDGRTPLMAATWNGHTEIASLLLDYNVDPNRKNRDGWSSLMFAALKGDTDVARILLLHGADPTIKNNEGNTCSQLAALQGHDQFISLLSSHN